MAYDLRTLQELSAAFREYPEQADKAAKLALKTAARDARVAGAQAIRGQVALSATYVNKHLKVVQGSQSGDLEMRIRAEPREVLLTRYGAKMKTVRTIGKAKNLSGDIARGIPPGRKAQGTKGVKVKASGSKKELRNTFWVRIQNIGEWAPAERIGNNPDDIRVLHGPSVDQVWKDVRDEVLPGALDNMASEFSRQFTRLIG